MARTHHHADKHDRRAKQVGLHQGRRSRARSMLARMDWDEMPSFESNASTRSR